MSDHNRLVLFDCDGTLVDGQHLIFDAMVRTFDLHDLPPLSRLEVRGVIGLSLPDAMNKLLPGTDAALHDRLSESYKQAFHEMHVDGEMKAEPLYEGAREAIMELDGRGYVLGVATGKSMRGLKRVLAHHGLTDMFVTLQTADFHPSKPHPAMAQVAMAEAGAAPESTVMIGDTSYDMMMGRSAGTHVIGVDWGYHDGAELQRTGAHHVVDDWAGLVKQIDLLLNEAD